jgi:hypothetical protein
MLERQRKWFDYELPDFIADFECSVEPPHEEVASPENYQDEAQQLPVQIKSHRVDVWWTEEQLEDFLQDLNSFTQISHRRKNASLEDLASAIEVARCMTMATRLAFIVRLCDVHGPLALRGVLKAVGCFCPSLVGKPGWCLTTIFISSSGMRARP